MHVTGASLGFAIDQNRILIINRFINAAPGGFCQDFAHKAECFFKPITNCTLTDTSDVQEMPLTGARDIVPAVFRNELDKRYPGITDALKLYWWRAQSVGYLFRLNERSLERIRTFRFAPENHFSSSPDFFPVLPPGTASIHIRGGDKSREMRLVPPIDFINKVFKVAEDMPFSVSMSRTVIYTGDLSEAEQLFTETTQNAGWNFFYSKIYRVPGGFSLATQGAPGNKSDHAVLHLGQLLLALEADVWIGTRGSNWNRLIEELRCVWVPKCQQPFYEIGDPRAYDWRN